MEATSYSLMKDGKEYKEQKNICHFMRELRDPGVHGHRACD